MVDSFIQLPGDSTGKLVDTSQLTVGANTVERERMIIAGSSDTALATVTSSGGLQVHVTNSVTVSGAVTVSGTVASTVATNPWSSAPGFNLPVISASSGLVQISGIPTVVVTTSGGLGASNIRALSSGTVTLSSAIALSSGIVTMSSVQTVTATAGTNPWSSAPGFNVPVVSASSGFLGAYQSTQPWLVDITSTGNTGGIASKFFTQTSGGSTMPQGVASTSPVRLFSISGWTSILSTVALNFLQVYNTASSAATVGTTTPILVVPFVAYSSAAAAGAPAAEIWDSVRGVACTGGLSVAVTQTATGTTAGSARFTLQYST